MTVQLNTEQFKFTNNDLSSVEHKAEVDRALKKPCSGKCKGCKALKQRK